MSSTLIAPLSDFMLCCAPSPCGAHAVLSSREPGDGERMALRLYNTMSRQTEPFQPRSNPATLYVCGVTPYDTTHLGDARTYVVFDVLQRYLAHLGVPVRYVQNVTD